MGITSRSLVFFAVCAALLVLGKSVQAEPVVVGTAKCLDCSRKNNLKPEHAFKGLNVAIKCKASSGEYETKAVGKLDGKGAFSIPLAAELLGDDGELKQECQAALQSAASTPCDAQPSKLVVSGKHTFATATGEIPFASATCASDFLWKWKWDLFHKFHKHFVPAPAYKSPTPVYKPAPVYTPTPVYGKPAPVYTPTPVYGEPTPVYGNPAPVYTPTPVYGKPAPVYTPTPVYGKPAPVYTPTPEYKPPVYTPTPVYGKPAPYYKPFPFNHPHPWKKFFKKKHPFWPPAAKKQEEGTKN